MSAVAAAAAAQRHAAVKAALADRLVGVMVAETNSSSQRATQVSRQVDDVVTTRFHLYVDQLAGRNR